MSDGGEFHGALERAAAAAPGLLLEPAPAYTHQEVHPGLTILRAEDSEGITHVHPSTGTGNFLFCGHKSRFAGKWGIRIRIAGSNNVIFVGPHAAVSGLEVDIKGDDNVFYFGAFSSTGNMVVDLAQNLTANVRGRGAKIVIGDHCMIATRVNMSNSDGHGIYDRATGERLNLNSDIIVGNHMWIAREVKINKGVQIGRDCVIGQGSVVSGTLDEACIYAGVPAKKRREGVTWSRMDCASISSMEDTPRHKAFLRKMEALKARIASLHEDATGSPTV